MKFLIPDEHRKASGVYIIRNTVNEKVYVGSAGMFRLRFHHHTSALRKGQHSSIKLQNFANKYGSESLTFELLELTSSDKSEIYQAEQKWINTYQSWTDAGFNILANVVASGGVICKETRNCLECGNGFEAPKTSPQKYCSRPCGDKGHGRMRKGVKRGKETVDKIIASKKEKRQAGGYESDAKKRSDAINEKHRKLCPECGNNFIPPVKRRFNVFCSVACSNKSPLGKTRVITEEQKARISKSVSEFYKTIRLNRLHA